MGYVVDLQTNNHLLQLQQKAEDPYSAADLP